MGVRFGVSLDQGKRCSMEDTAACFTDAFSVDSRGEEISGDDNNDDDHNNNNNDNNNNSDSGREAGLAPEEHPVQLAAMTPMTGAPQPASTAATEAGTVVAVGVNATSTTTTATAEATEAAAYFGLFDGKDE